MADKALFQYTIGVFGLVARIDGQGVVRIKVNVRTDQERQWALAKLKPIPGTQIVDCPGGGVQPGETLWEALVREFSHETGGCTIESLTNYEFNPPLWFWQKDLTKPSDAALWMPCKMYGTPTPSNEASDHPWISSTEFEAETPYRCVSGLGNKGRTGQMMRAALDWFEANRLDSEIFS